MSNTAARFRAFLIEAPHWLDMLAAVPAWHVQRHDTIHPAFHGCIDWHSACHATWALIAHQGLTGDTKHRAIVDAILMPGKLAAEAADLAARPDFEMPYGRAWLLRLALEDRVVTGSTRLTVFAREAAASLISHYRANPPEPFSREYSNPSWALINLLDYAKVEGRSDVAEFVRETAARMTPLLDSLPSAAEEETWTDFMAVTPNFCELMVRAEAADARAVMTKAGARLLALRPIAAPQRPHHYALNFSRAWSFFALFEAVGDTRLLDSYLDHVQMSLGHPSWWRGDYRAVAHWVPQFGIFALQRALRHQNQSPA